MRKNYNKQELLVFLFYNKRFPLYEIFRLFCFHKRHHILIRIAELEKVLLIQENLLLNIIVNMAAFCNNKIIVTFSSCLYIKKIGSLTYRYRRRLHIPLFILNKIHNKIICRDKYKQISWLCNKINKKN